MDAEYCLEDDQAQKITKENGRCSDSTDMAKNLVMEDLPGSANDEEDENVADLSDLEDVEVQRQRLNAKLEFLDVMLQRVKEEERLRLASGLSPYTSGNLLRKSGWNQLDSHYNENLANPVSNLLSEDGSFEKSFPLLSYGQIEDNTLENLNLDCSYPSIKTGKDSGRSSPPPTVIPKADPDASKSDISLDNLTIKELHETFKATFGRETSVKDKQWLKRRISIGLTNFNKKTNKKEKINSRPGKSLAQQFPADSAKVQMIKSEVVVDGSVEAVARKRPLGQDSSTTLFTDIVPKTEFELSNDEVPLGEEIVGKRMRKPTRRYIEELSDVDSRLNSGKPAIVERDSDQGYTPVKSHARPYWNEFDRMALVFRQDSLGGCGIQVPFVLRLRRGRPRKNCSSLLKNKSSGRAANLVTKELHVQPAQYSGDTADMKQIVPFGSSQKDLQQSKSNGRDANLVKQSLCVPAAHYSSDTANMKQIVPFGSSQNIVHDNKEIKEQALVSVPPDRNYVLEPSNSDSLDDISYDYLKTIRTAKGGIRRKHHRSWTLHEVVKLVEGVSHFGVGRWSDIKKLAFSSSVYRTSVDLKDKWRNLLRASYAQLQTNKQAVNRRNHASVPIPAAILVRVRELAATQSRAICAPSSNSSLSRSGRTVHKRHIM